MGKRRVALSWGASLQLLLVVLVVAGCGSDSSSTSGPATLSGTVSEGPVGGATVSVFSVNPVNGANQSLLGQTQTDSAGNFSIRLGTGSSGPVRVAASGGSFISEVDGATIGGSAELSLLLGNAASNFSGLAINPLSEFVDSRTVGELRSGGGSFTNALRAAILAIEHDYGLATNPGLLSPNYSTGAIGTDAGKIGLVLGALINEDQELCPGHPGGLVDALSADIADGAFDGMNFGTPVAYCGGNLEPIAGTSIFQDALSGVQQLQLVTAAFVFGGSGNVLTASGITPDQLLVPLAAINPGVSLAAPRSVNSFAPSTPSMNVARLYATATLLPNGKVLIAGGTTGFPFSIVLKSVELYDPVTNSFAPAASTPSMNSGRSAATATLLPNGKVLIAGGSGLPDADLYDPATNTFAASASTPPMIATRSNASAALLPNGKVLIAGGLGNLQALKSAELYDPATNSFVSAPSMNVARYAAAASLLPNGRVLIAGGLSDFDAFTSVELYDPVSNSFAASTPPLNMTHASGATASLLPNGKVLIAGGDCCDDPGDVELYDPVTNSFNTSIPPMNVARENATATLLPNGKVLIAGGGLSGSLSSTELYDPVSNSFAASTPSMNVARLGATATLLPNGKVLIAGGVLNTKQTLNSTEIYTP